MNLLILDDSLTIRVRLHRLCAIALGSNNILEAGTVKEAVALVDEHHPEIALLDLHLPDGSGIEVLRHIRQLDYPCQIIILTNYTSAEYEKQCRELGANHFLDKSMQFSQLPNLLKEKRYKISNGSR